MQLQTGSMSGGSTLALIVCRPAHDTAQPCLGVTFTHVRSLAQVHSLKVLLNSAAASVCMAHTAHMAHEQTTLHTKFCINTHTILKMAPMDYMLVVAGGI